MSNGIAIYHWLVVAFALALIWWGWKFPEQLRKFPDQLNRVIEFLTGGRGPPQSPA
jgi:hypothetical protein